MEDARDNAPNTVLTLDRVVSLHDYEDFARGFAGIGKAQAARLWTGRDFLIHITAATASGQPLTSGDIYDNLVAAIDDARDPQEALLVSGYVPVMFSFEADVLIDTPRYLAEDVLADVRALLHDTFSFDRRSFGQPVTLAEVVTTIQQVTGVIAADMVEPHPAQRPSYRLASRAACSSRCRRRKMPFAARPRNCAGRARMPVRRKAGS